MAGQDAMKVEFKKILLNLVAVIAVSLSIACLFSPLTSFDFSDVYENTGYPPLEVNCKKESYIFLSPLISHYKEYDYRINENLPVYEKYNLMFNIELEKGEPTGEFLFYKYYENINENENIFALGSPARNFCTLLIRISSIILFSYFVYKGFKKIEYKKNIYFLYASFVVIFGIIVKLALVYNSFDTADSTNSMNLNYTNFLTLGYGFYLAFFSIIMFFTAFIIQNYFSKLINYIKTVKIKQ